MSHIEPMLSDGITVVPSEGPNSWFSFAFSYPDWIEPETEQS